MAAEGGIGPGRGNPSRGLFSTLPSGFFSPLASPNREHYAACLLSFYRAFQETSGGVERSVFVARLSGGRWNGAGRRDALRPQSGAGRVDV
jgi:hypothetical protein